MKLHLNDAQNGFIKGLLVVVLAAATSYFGDSANLAPVIGIPLAGLVAGIASALESHIKAHTGKGLMGAVRIR